MTPALSTALSQALTIVLVAAIPVLVGYTIAGVNKLWTYLESKISATDLATAKSAAADAVKAAEVLGAQQFIASKESWAVTWLTKVLQSKGITLDVAEMVGLVKSAYLEQITPANELPTVKAAVTAYQATQTPPVVPVAPPEPLAPTPVPTPSMVEPAIPVSQTVAAPEPQTSTLPPAPVG